MSMIWSENCKMEAREENLSHFVVNILLPAVIFFSWQTSKTKNISQTMAKIGMLLDQT